MRRHLRWLWLPLLSACSATQQHDESQSPGFEPVAGSVLVGDPIELQLTGLTPGAEVAVTAERIYGRSSPALMRSTATFEADSKGELDLASAEPISAPWEGVDPRGLFWSMRKSEQEPDDSWVAGEVRLSADVDGDGSTDASATVRLRNGDNDLVESPLGSEFPGAFLLRPAGDDVLPAIVVLGGSEGGDSAARALAPRLASRGYAVVGYPYYSPAYYGQEKQFPELPTAFDDIPLDPLEQVRDWLRQRADVDGDRIGLYGVSKGAEFVLAAASRMEGFAAVVAIVPSDVIWEGWGPGTSPGQDSSFSWQGKPLPFVPYQGMAEEIAKNQTGETIRIRTPHDAGRAANAERIESARIAVEQIDEPVFVVGGDEDNTWDSGGMARNILAAREAAGLQTVAIVDEEAGHGLSGTGYRPMSAADARVQGQAFPAMLQFFAQHLKPSN